MYLTVYNTLRKHTAPQLDSEQLHQIREKMTYHHGDWYVFCDICGQRKLASKTTKLTTYTGHGEAIVCNHDVDLIDYGLVPYKPRREQNVPWARIGDDNTDNSAPLVDLETMSYIYYLVASQSNSILASSQDGALITVNQPI